ncbi:MULTISPECIES: ABC transporter permease subunit [unclassified Spiroplasma]|uniref:ABC transporter permease subunit n=1 Tax=unclassified Spiroplasma TaxID=2637901 RepID=UPI00313DF8E0
MNIIRNFWTNKKLKAATVVSLTVVLLFVLSAIIFTLFKVSSLKAYDTLFLMPFNDINHFHNFVNSFSYLLLASLASLVAFRFRIYNLGVIGQMIIGVTITFITSRLLSAVGITTKFTTMLLILVSIIAGALYALIAGFFKTYFKINEMASTLLLNIIAFNIYYHLPEWSQYNDGIINNNASLIIKLSMTVYFSITIFIALFIYGFVTILLDRRVFGFRLELTVANAEAAQYARLNPNAKQLIIMTISGAIAGIAGYTYFVANLNKLGTLSSTMLQEFDNLLIPLWAFNSRIGVLLLSILVGLIRSQTQFLSLTSFDYEIIDIIFSFCITISVLVSYIILWKQEPKFLINFRMREALVNQRPDVNDATNIINKGRR